MFCIDHKRGTIKTTQYFDLQPNRTLHFIMHYVVQVFTTEYPNIPAITVRVTSRCDLMTSLATTLKDQCDNSHLEIIHQGTANNPRDEVVFDLKMYNQLQQSEYYMTQVNVDFAHMLLEEKDGEEESNFLLTIGIKKGRTSFCDGFKLHHIICLDEFPSRHSGLIPGF